MDEYERYRVRDRLLMTVDRVGGDKFLANE